MKDFITKWICILAIQVMIAVVCIGVWRVCELLDTGGDTTVVGPDQKTIDNAWLDYSTAPSNTTATDQTLTISILPGAGLDQGVWDVFNTLADSGEVVIQLSPGYEMHKDMVISPNIEVRVGD